MKNGCHSRNYPTLFLTACIDHGTLIAVSFLVLRSRLHSDPTFRSPLWEQPPRLESNIFILPRKLYICSRKIYCDGTRLERNMAILKWMQYGLLTWQSSRFLSSLIRKYYWDFLHYTARWFSTREAPMHYTSTTKWGPYSTLSYCLWQASIFKSMPAASQVPKRSPILVKRCLPAAPVFTWKNDRPTGLLPILFEFEQLCSIRLGHGLAPYDLALLLMQDLYLITSSATQSGCSEMLPCVTY